MSLQTRFAILPVFIPEIIQHMQPEVGRWLELQNIGNGPALNVRIDPIDIILDIEAPNILPAPNIEFEQIVYIPPQVRVPVRHWSYISKDKDRKPMNTSVDWLFHLMPGMITTDSYIMKVRFRDVFGNKYVQKIQLTKSGCWPEGVEEDK